MYQPEKSLVLSLSSSSNGNAFSVCVIYALRLNNLSSQQFRLVCIQAKWTVSLWNISTTTVYSDAKCILFKFHESNCLLVHGVTITTIHGPFFVISFIKNADYIVEFFFQCNKSITTKVWRDFSISLTLLSLSLESKDLMENINGNQVSFLFISICEDVVVKRQNVTKPAFELFFIGCVKHPQYMSWKFVRITNDNKQFS